MEPIEIFAAKSSEELVTEQAFICEKVRGERLILRPEMTPTLARMVAAKVNELILPLRWYSVPNCFRYERPQRGRRREFRQVNVDILGHDGLYADLECFAIIANVMASFGIKPAEYQIRWNNRRFLDELLVKVIGIPESSKSTVYKMVDKKEKMEPAEYESWVREELRDDTAADRLLQIGTFHDPNNLPFDNVPEDFYDGQGASEVRKLTELIDQAGISASCTFSPEVVRGLDYYTGTVYEVFDTGTENRRALFGGGSYDNLVELFSEVALPGTGFGMGVYVLGLFLDTYGKIPAEVRDRSLPQSAYIAPIDGTCIPWAITVAQTLHAAGKGAIVAYDCRKVGRQLETASKQGFPYAIIIGKRELEAQQVTLKDLRDGTQQTLSIDDLASAII
jgi:histidyl-tRNA synthetase